MIMMNRAAPRLAKLDHVRANPRATTLIAIVTRGPKTELHREVHIPVGPEHLHELKRLVAELESRSTS